MRMLGKFQRCRGYKPIFSESKEGKLIRLYRGVRIFTSKICTFFERENLRILAGIFILNGFFYLFLFLLSVGFIYPMSMISLVLQKEQPLYMDILTRSPGLFPAVNGFTIGGYDCHNFSTYENMVNNIQKMLRAYNSQVGVPLCTPGGNHEGNCVFDISTLDICSGGDYGFSVGKPCVYIMLSKIANFVPIPIGNSEDYVDISCHGISPTGEISDVIMFPKKGLLLDAFPYKYDRERPRLSPLVAIVTDATKSYQVRCAVMAKNINLSKSYEPDIAVGKVEINVKTLSEACP